MNKRDLILEIQEKNERASNLFLHGNLELYSLESSCSGLNDSNPTLLALHVMGVASCIEVSVREAIKRLVDFGDPYFERAELFKEHIKFDYLLTKALSTGKITFGDLISHSLPVSRIEHIASHFEVLFSEKPNRKNFQTVIAGVRKYVEPDDEELFGHQETGSAQRSAPLLVTDSEALLKDVAHTFKIRHLVAHEAIFNVIKADELGRLMQSARLFVDALYELVEQIINPGASRSGFGGSIQEHFKAGNVREAALKIQDRILGKISALNTEHFNKLALFSKTIETFDSYHEAESYFRFAVHDNPNGNAMRNIEANVTKQLWRHRMEYLTEVENDIDFFLRF